MIPFLPEIIGAATNAFGAIMGKKGQDDANAANAAQAKQQMDFQERMRGSQYQATVEDLKKAGLNPALAYGQGGAGTPTGASAQIQNSLAGTGGTAQAAVSTYAAIAQARNIEAQTQQLKLESIERLRNLAADTIGKTMDPQTRSNEAGARIDETRQRIGQNRQSFEIELKRLKTQLELLDFELPGARNRAGSENTRWGKYVRPYINDAKAAKQIF